MNENKIKIELEVYDELLEVYANKSDVKRYIDAAKMVTERYNTYSEFFREKKSHHTIALITMLDIALRSKPDGINKGQYRSFRGIIKDYWNKLIQVPQVKN